MKLDCVLTASNENKLYLDFIPIFIKTWNKLCPDIDVKIILIAKNIPNDLLCHENNIILFKPIEDISTSFTSQFIRLLYPCILNYENGVLITDIDMLPMNKNYYTESIKSYGSDKFIYYRGNVCSKNKEIAMCYNVATPRIWNDIFRINTIEDIREKLKFIFSDAKGKKSMWSVDQKFLYDKLTKWNEKTNNFIRHKNDGFKRLNRKSFDINDEKIRKNISDGKYSDYHCYRPMSKYSEINYEIYNLLPYSMKSSFKKDIIQNSIFDSYKNLNFESCKLKSPIGEGLFNIFLNKDNNVVYKKIKKNIKDIKNYKDIIYNIKNDTVLGKFIYEPEKNYIEDDGSYYSSYIKNGIRLYDINLKYNTDKATLEILKKSISDMKKNLNDYVQTKTLSGDWGLHNLIYCLDTNIIYNIDLEGFYTYPFKISNGNCKIKYCNDRFDKLLDIIDKLISKKNDISNNNYFTLILWNPTLFQSDEILKEIPNIIEKKYIVVPKEQLYNYIFNIYKYDVRCSHHKVLPTKIDKLREYDNKHLIVKFIIENPQFSNNLCMQAIKLKEIVRKKYKSNIKNYVKDIMIHVADDFKQSQYIWEYDSSHLITFP